MCPHPPLISPWPGLPNFEVSIYEEYVGFCCGCLMNLGMVLWGVLYLRLWETGGRSMGLCFQP